MHTCSYLGTHLCRSLSSLPPNVLSPGAYCKLLQAYAAEYQWEYKEWSAEQLKDIGNKLK